MDLREMHFMGLPFTYSWGLLHSWERNARHVSRNGQTSLIFRGSEFYLFTYSCSFFFTSPWQELSLHFIVASIFAEVYWIPQEWKI